MFFNFYSKSARAFGESVIAAMQRVYDAKDASFVCIVHNDVWTNNLLFR